MKGDIIKNFEHDVLMEQVLMVMLQHMSSSIKFYPFEYLIGLEDAAAQSRLTHDRMSAEESRLFPEICKGEIKRHKAFLIIRNNIVSKIFHFRMLSVYLCNSFECGSMNLGFN